MEPEVVRQVGLIWVDGDPMLPLTKAMLDLLKTMLSEGELFPAAQAEAKPASAVAAGRAAPAIRAVVGPRK